MDHANDTEPVNFYDEGEYYEEETAEVYESDSDSDYEPPTFISARDALMLFSTNMLTRSMRDSMIERMGGVNRELRDMHNGIMSQIDLSNLFQADI
jgi:hypothetical protein